MMYRHGYSTPDIEKADDELMVASVQPVDKNAEPLARANLKPRSVTRIIRLPE